MLRLCLLPEHLAVPAPLSTQLTETQLDQLSDFLSITQGPVADLEMLDGFFAALICGPELVKPSEALTEVWGEDFDFESQDQAMHIVGLLMQHWNTIASTLENTLSTDDVYVPVMLEREPQDYPAEPVDGDAQADAASPADAAQTPEISAVSSTDGTPMRARPGNTWAEGFMKGVNLRRAAWQPFLDQERISDAILPMLILGLERDPEHALPLPNGISPTARDDLIVRMAAGLTIIYRHLHEARSQAGLASQMPNTPVRRAMPKVGRNDPCPCGSGKKFKQCCGKNGG